MEIQYIFEFLELAKTRSFSETASKLYISQSSLSKHLILLEEEVGAVLFDRNSRNVSLSDYGKLYLPYARRMWSLYRESLLRVEREKAGRSRNISIAFIQDSHRYNVSGILFAFKKEYPDYSVNVLEVSEEEELRLFRERKINLIGVSVSSGEKTGYGFIPLGKSRIVAVFPDGHPLFGKESVKASSLAGEPLILPSRSMKVFKIITDAIKSGREKIKPNIVFEGSPESCMQFASEGMGILLQPLDVIESFGKNTVYSELEPKIELFYGLGYRDYQLLSEGEKLLVDFNRQFIYS